MAHPEQQAWCRQLKARFPGHFHGRRVLDVGALDVNGNNRHLFEGGQYIGLDIGPGPNVDVVGAAHEYAAPDESFEVVLSTEAFEHDRYWPLTLSNMIRLLQEHGLLFFTCATTGRAEHGTRRTSPELSPGTSTCDDWADYYRNLTESDVRAETDVDQIFAAYEFEVDTGPHDLRFWGIKRPGSRCELP